MMRKNNLEDIQEIFLNRVKSALPASTSLAAELSDLLDISMDSAYRRIRGETPLSLKESYILAERFNISLAGITSDSIDVVRFGYAQLSPDIESMERYLTRLLENVRMIGKVEGSKIMYCSQDVPIFYNLSLPHLAQFKIFYWLRSIMNESTVANQKLGPDTIPSHLMEMCKAISAEYNQIDSQELWTASTLYSTLRQVQYYWESGLFESPEIGHAIVGDIRLLLDKIEEMASRGWKNPMDQKGKYELYVSEIELTTNCALANMAGQKAVFLGHHTFNMLETSHESYTIQTQKWFENMMGKATLISSVGEKYRYQFFQQARKKINELEASF